MAGSHKGGYAHKVLGYDKEDFVGTETPYLLHMPPRCLMDLRLEGEITKEEFEIQKRRLKDKQHEFRELITLYDKADDNFSKALISLITIASDSDKLWASSTISEKRELLNLVFANLQLKGATLCYTLKKPFDSMLKLSNFENWRCWQSRQQSSLNSIP